MGRGPDTRLRRTNARRFARIAGIISPGTHNYWLDLAVRGRPVMLGIGVCAPQLSQ